MPWEVDLSTLDLFDALWRQPLFLSLYLSGKVTRNVHCHFGLQVQGVSKLGEKNTYALPPKRLNNFSY